MRSEFFSVIALLAAAGAHAEDVDLEKVLGSLIAAEKAYAKLAGEKGFREASISVFADDAVIFAPSAVNGKKFWREAKKDPVISWRPSFASISRSGELGYTTGPWESRKSRDIEKPDAFGHFVTIWQKNKDNEWKVVLDVGLDHPQPQGVETEISTYVPNAAIRHSESASADLEKAQRRFAESLKEDEADAIIDDASDNVRVYRSGQLPVIGKNAVGKMLAEEDAKTTRTPLGTGITSPVDLAYEYGEYMRNRDKINERGIYLCIWRLESDGTWKIALDLQKSAPTEKPYHASVIASVVEESLTLVF
jgi:ketosteroid isomerase-like protein